MNCKNCELRQRQYYCENCLRSHLRDFRLQTQVIAADRDEQVQKAKRALTAAEQARLQRADVAAKREMVDTVKKGLAKMRAENEAARQRIATLRGTIASRKQTLLAARTLPEPSLDGPIIQQTKSLALLSDTLARARSGLVQELVEVFNVVEVGGRPPIGGKAGTKGEWTIGDLVLPVPGDIRRYPPDRINAVITHTVHFIGLLTFYLGIKLPFHVTWTGRGLGVGQPYIQAIKGTESGGWAKWTTKQPLHLSSSPPPTTRSSSPSSSPNQSQQHLISDSYIVETDVSAGDTETSNFTTGFAMLLYDVCYLAHTQCVEVPLSQAGDVLSNLWAVCCSPELGRCSHQTHPLLPPPTPASFPLSFSQLLQAMTTNPASRARAPRSHRSSTGTSKRPLVTKTTPAIAEEDEWDMVEDGMDSFV